jgi:hypothetical protein
MLPTNYVIAYGSLETGFKFVGPFNTEREAVDFADEYQAHQSTIAWSVHRLIDPLSLTGLPIEEA